MARVVFASSMDRRAALAKSSYDGETLAEVLRNVFVESPPLRDLLLDDLGRLRPHFSICINGQRLHDCERLSDYVPANAEVFVFPLA